MFDRLKRVLPVSSRSFHARTNEVERRLSDLQNGLERNTLLLEKLQGHLSRQNAIYLICEPGYPNYGDELIAREWIRYFAAEFPWRPVYLDCARPGPASAILGDIHPNLIVVDTLARLTLEGECINDLRENAKWVASAIDDESKAARYALGIRCLRNNTGAIHVAGGGYMNSMWKANLARMAVGLWAKSEHIPVLATGLGLLPLEEDDVGFAKDMAACFDLFAVRDHESQDVLGKEMAKVLPDDCFVNALDGCCCEAEGLPDIMVCVQSDFIDDSDALFRQVNQTLASWNVSKGETVGVVECMPYSDYPILEYLEDAGYKCKFYPTAFLLSEGFPARPGQKWISTRYHPHLIAAAFGCSGSFISPNEDYYAIKHNAVLDMGSHWTRNVIGCEPPGAGAGFSNANTRYAHRDKIREAVSPFYRCK